MSTLSMLCEQSLQSAGWTVLRGHSATAVKAFDTACGPKEAQMYLIDRSLAGRTSSLQGFYFSEGRNVLEPLPLLLAPGMHPVLIRQRIFEFFHEVEARVLDTYAARLLRA